MINRPLEFAGYAGIGSILLGGVLNRHSMIAAGVLVCLIAVIAYVIHLATED